MILFLLIRFVTEDWTKHGHFLFATWHEPCAFICWCFD